MSEQDFCVSRTKNYDTPSSRRFLTPAVCVLVVATILLAMAPQIASAATRVVNGIVVQGSILNEYNRLESIGRSPQRPAAAEQNDRQGGKFQRFYTGGSSTVNNTIYWNARVDAGRGRQIGGAIYTKWGQLDWENGYLGYPKTSEENAANGGKFNFFEGGSMYWSSSYGAHPVVGQILETWAANGYETGLYGYPRGDEETYGDGKRQLFQNGQYIEWHPEGFSADWAGDTYQDNNPNNNSDAYVPTCDDACGNDASIKINGGEPNQADFGGSRVAEPSAARGDTVPTNGTPWCDAVKPDPSAPAGRGLVCLVRPGSEDDFAKMNGGPKPSDPSTTPSTQAPRPSGTGEQSPMTTPAPSSIPTPESTTPTTSSTAEKPSQAPPSTESCGPSASTSDSSTPSSTPSTCPESSATTTTQGAANSAPRDGFTANPVVDGIYTPPLLPDDREKYCDSYASDFVDKKWRGERMFQCRTETYNIGFADRRSGTPVGTARMRESRNQTTYYNNTAWTDRVSIFVQDVVGLFEGADAAIGATEVTYTLQCLCYAPPAAGQGQIVATIADLAVKEETAFARRGLVAQANSSASQTSAWTWETANPLFSPASGNTGISRLIRCDAQSGLRSTQGCAFTGVTPAIDYTMYTTLDEYNNHVKKAQQSGLPGTRQNGPLHRISDESVIRANRRGSCGGVTGPRNNGKSCDEYPVASSDEGGRRNGPNSGGTARTFLPECNIRDNEPVVPGGTGDKGYSVCLIDEGQNGRAGALLSWFYTKNRVIPGDPFYIDVG